VALDPSNLVPGVGLSPDRMLQARVFAYADQQRYRIGANYKQLPVNQPLNADKVNTYEHEGSMSFLFNNEDDPVYSPNRYGKGAGYLYDSETSGQPTAHACATYVNPDPDGTDLVRASDVKHQDDDDFIQPGFLYREVMDEG